MKILNKSLILFSLLINAFSFSQTLVNSFPIDLKSNTDVFQIVNDSAKQTTLFVSDRKKVLAFSLDENMNIKDSISSKRPEKKYKDIIGFSGYKENPRLYWASENYEDIFSQFYDFKNHRIETLGFKIDVRGEKFLQLFSENKNFYILSLIRNSNILKFYIFSVEGKLEIKEIDLSSLSILIGDEEKGQIHDILSEDSELSKDKATFLDQSYAIEKITSDSPTSLTEGCRKLKCYSRDTEFILSFDYNNSFSQLISIDLNTFEYKLKEFKKPTLIREESETMNSNSFLFENKLVQFILTSSKMSLVVKDMNDVLLKEYSLNETDPITFKNSDIIRIRSYSGTERILDKTSQFLKKVNNKNCGITCYNLNGNIMLTLGSVSEEEIYGGGMTGSSFMMPVRGTNFSIPFGGSYMGYNISPTFGKFGSYANRRVVYFDCLFDKEMNHIKGRIAPLAFEKIKDFVGKYPISSRTIFTLENSYYLGYYDSMAKSYVLQKFTD